MLQVRLRRVAAWSRPSADALDAAIAGTADVACVRSQRRYLACRLARGRKGIRKAKAVGCVSPESAIRVFEGRAVEEKAVMVSEWEKGRVTGGMRGCGIRGGWGEDGLGGGSRRIILVLRGLLA